MAKYIVLALNGPKPGPENEDRFNKWYDEVHLKELRAVEGIVAARRFKSIGDKAPWPYVSLYEVETDDLPAFLDRMSKGHSGLDESFDTSKSASIIAVELMSL